MRRTNRRLLEMWADYIEMTLGSHGIGGQVLGGTDAPRWTRFKLALDWGVKPERVQRLAGDIASRLQVQFVRIAPGQDGQLYIEVPKPRGETIFLYDLCKGLDNVPRQAAVLGMDEEGRPLLLRLPSPDVGHVLVAGTTGSGKTALARGMALSLAMHNRQGEIQLAIVDPKGRGYGALAGMPHLLRSIIVDGDEATYFLAVLVEEMLERDRQKISEPRIVVVIDEMADLVEADGKILRYLTRLTQRGREAGIHIIGCTQKPTANSIGSLVKSNFPVRLVGSVASPEDAKVAAGIGGTGAERLTGRGDFLLIAKGQVRRFQAAYVDGKTARALVARMAAGQRESRRWLTEYPLEESAALLDRPGRRVEKASRWTPRVVVDNRPDRIEGDAQLVLNEPGWAEAWLEDGQFRYGYQSEIGRLIGQENAGAGRKHILAVAQRVLELCASSTTSTTDRAEAKSG